MTPASVPDGFTVRPLRYEDATAVTEVIAACELHDDGAVEIELDDVNADWARPSLDLATRSIGVFDRDRLVACGQVFLGRAEVDVRPEYRGRGIGGWLMHWTWDRVREEGRAQVGESISDANTDATELFLANGYEPAWTSWILRIELEEAIAAAPALPAGLSLRDYEPGFDDRPIYALIDAAFGEREGHESWTFEDYHAAFLGRLGVEVWQVVLAVDGGPLAGVAFLLPSVEEGWVQQLAVDAAYRRRGLGTALLQESFRRCHAHGFRRCGLATDSRSGARGFYERAGMRVARSYTRYRKRLD